MNSKFIENDSGVHIQRGEFTLCGDALDSPETERDWSDGEFRETAKRVVSCPRCAEIVLDCRGVRVAPIFLKQDRK